jgi:hypothetical protein
VARWADDSDPIPERLARFVPSEWGEVNPAGEWGRAAREWLAAHPGRRLPLAGDPVEVRQRVVELGEELWRAGHPGWAAPMPPMPRGWAADADGSWHD